jgi:predicted ribosome quality control (RQC) complex YloA/Tae2 family protein
MKLKFSRFSLVGYRVNQIYDIDNKTYLIRLHQNESKTVLLLESGNRIHTTMFEWPKNVSPSGFTMKLRKHLKNKRLEAISQLGIDRVIDLQFGTGEACYHVILELYDRGNIILCDCEYIILNVLRPHVEGEEIRFAVREKYPLSRARIDDGPPSADIVKEKITQAHPGDSLRTVLNPLLPFGASLIDHCLIENNLQDVKIGGEKPEEEASADGQKKKKKKNRNKGGNEASREFVMEQDFPTLMNAINGMHLMMQKAMREPSAGFIVQKKETKPSQDGKEEFYFTNIEFQPYLYNQYIKEPTREFPSFVQAVDEFYSNLESQKIDLKAFQQEREALKKLSNVRQDHASRLQELAKLQHIDRQKAELITRNQVLVDSVIYAMRALLAKQISWTDIKELIKERQDQNDQIAGYIKQLKLETNHITLRLSDPFGNLDDDEDDDDDDQREEDEQKLEPMDIDIDLGCSAYSNATRYYDQKRGAAKKEQKTIEASGKALKSAEKKTQQTLKDVRIQSTISKARKVFWFEKFYWFISSENYLVIGGRDQQQNELIVKRYLRASDVYVHAEIQGASSVVIKNPNGGDVPPKTLLEAGTMAISYSVAWDAKVVTSAYWVKADQVSKTAPTGEYLSTGSFMIRGKKNFLPPCHLILGLSFLFKLEESSVERHRGERRVRKFDDDASSIMTENEQLESIHEEEIPIGSDGEDSDEKQVLTEVVAQMSIEEEVPESESEESESGFPDTHVKVEHTTGQVDIQADPKLERMLLEENQEELTLIQAAPLKVKAYEKKLKPQKKKQQPPPPPKEEKDDGKNQPKRGQKGKMKKIKEKYKDQDEEDRAMIMDIIKSAGSGKDSRKTKKQEEEENYKKSAARKPQPKPKAGEEMDDTPAADEVDMLDQLTGIPHDEDELLFAVPVVAPYQTLHNYK